MEVSIANNHNLKYKDADYWNERFAEEDSYEWLATYEDIKPIMKEALNKVGPEAKILQIGCGNSQLALDLYDDGFQDITNIDISEVVINKMTAKHPHLKFVQMDATKLDFGKEKFDFVIEKATLDAFLVDSASPWDLTSNGSQKVLQVLENVKKVLKVSGVFMSITFSQPHFRVPLLANKGLKWSIKVGIFSFLYNTSYYTTNIIKVDKFTSTGGVLDYYIFKCEEGDAGPAVAQWCVGGPKIENNEAWTSSDEEEFLMKIGTSSIGGSSDEEGAGSGGSQG